MHFHFFSDWLKILFVVLGVALGSCTSDRECYPEINKIFESLELNEKNDFSTLLKQRSERNEDIPLPIQEAMVFVYQKNQLSVGIKDKHLLELTKIFKRLDDLKKEEAKEMINRLLKDNSFETKQVMAYQYLLALHNSGISSAQLAFIREVNPDDLSITDLYYLLKTILTLSKKNKSSIDLNLKLSILHYGLQILETVPNAEKFLKLKGSYYLNIAKLLIQEEDHYEDLLTFFYKKAKVIFNQLGELDNLEAIDWYLADPEKSQVKVPNTNEIDWMSIGKIDKIVLATDIGYELMEENVLGAIRYLEFAHDFYSNSGCASRKYVIKNYLGAAYFNLGDFKKAREWFEKARIVSDCNERNKKKIAFVNSRYQSAYLLKMDNIFSPKNYYKKLKEERALGRRAMHGDHLIDYLVDNAWEVFKTFQSTPIQDSVLIGELLSLIDLTSIQSQNIFRKKALREEKKENNLEKLDLLNKINDFKDTTDYGNPIYKDLLITLIEEYDPTSQIGAINSIYNPQHLNSETAQGQIQTLGYLAFNGNYLGYHYSDSGLNIFDIPTKARDSLFALVMQNIAAKINPEHSIQELRKILLPKQKIDPVIPLTILPDGDLNFLPWHLLFSDSQQVNLALDLEDVTMRENVRINKLKAVVYSFSDSTAAFSAPTGEIPELVAGYEEADTIAKLLHPLDPQLIAGKDFNKASLFRGLTADLIHISSHSNSNRSNRLDNYVVLKNEITGKPDSVYAFELEAAGESPEVVILSACDTGIGLIKNGDGAYSLSRSFAQNGARAIVKSLWEVNAEHTKDFMIKLYEYWTTGVSLGTALQEARSYFEKELQKEPLFWAGFVLDGNPNIFLY